MKSAYVTTYDASDIGQWSGTGYLIAQALEQRGACAADSADMGLSVPAPHACAAPTGRVS
jgi:hypothetical protein